MTRWTASEDAQLRTLWAGDDLLRVMGQRLGRSADAVASRAGALGLPRRVLCGRGLAKGLIRDYPRRSSRRKVKASKLSTLQPHRNGTFDSRAALHRLWEAWCA